MQKNIIEIKGEVGYDVTYEGVLSKCSPDKDNVFVIDSVGGEVYEGFLIAELIKSLPKSTALIKKDCFSIATVIALSCNNVVMSESALFMIHNPYVMWLTCDADCLIEVAGELKEIEKELQDVYLDKTGLERDSIIEMMKNETFLDASEAMEYNFVNEITDNIYDFIMNLSTEEKEKKLAEIKNAGAINFQKKEQLKELREKKLNKEVEKDSILDEFFEELKTQFKNKCNNE